MLHLLPVIQIVYAYRGAKWLGK